MTEYACKKGFRIDVLEEQCKRDSLISIIEPKIRAFCAFCVADDVLIMDGDEGPELVTACDFKRVNGKGGTL